MSDLLPINATPAEHAIDDTIARFDAVPVPPRTVWNADTCANDLLPWLAWAVSVDEWSTTWTDQQKREAIKRSVLVHRYKGTIGAVREAVAALGVDCLVQEWFAQDPPGEPYTFRLVLDAQQAGITQQQLAKLVDVVNAAKNLRSHLDTIVPGATTNSEVFMAGAAGTGFEINVAFGGGNLVLDGTWLLDGTFKLNSLDI